MQKLHSPSTEWLHAALFSAAAAGDRDGLALLAEIARQEFGPRRAEQMVLELPLIAAPDEVEAVLRTLHADQFIAVARAIVLTACFQLVQLGVTPGDDISLSSAGDGRPTLHMQEKIHRQLQKIAPHGLHLLTPFLSVQ